jgi:hypothetical protein
LQAFGIDNRLRTVEIRPVTLTEALRLARQRRSRGHEFFEYGEDCLAATRIGFAKDEDDDFLEIDFTRDLIDLRYERRGPRGFLGFRAHKNETVRLTSMEQFESLLASYFNRDQEGFEAIFKELPGKKRYR